MWTSLFPLAWSAMSPWRLLFSIDACSGLMPPAPTSSPRFLRSASLYCCTSIAAEPLHTLIEARSSRAARARGTAGLPSAPARRRALPRGPAPSARPSAPGATLDHSTSPEPHISGDQRQREGGDERVHLPPPPDGDLEDNERDEAERDPVRDAGGERHQGDGQKGGDGLGGLLPGHMAQP